MAERRLRLGFAGGVLASLLVLASGSGAAQQASPVRVGVLTDMSGMVSDIGGLGSVEAARMAVEDFGGKVLGRPVEVLSADHQNKGDIGQQIARRWFDVDDVTMVMDLNNSAVAIGVQLLASEKNRVTFNTGAYTSDLYGKYCRPTGISYSDDTYALGNAIARLLSKEGAKTWFFVTADYAFGLALEAEMEAAIARHGGRIVGRVRHPIGTPDLSSFLIQAQASGADTIVLANSGTDIINAVKQASEFGIGKESGQRLVAPLMRLPTVRALGLKVAQGTDVMEGFYWDADDETRAFAKRFFARRQVMPAVSHAANYSATLQFLRAVEAVGSTDGAKIAQYLESHPMNDFYAKGSVIRPDGRLMRDYYQYRIKSPAESKYPFDFYDYVATVPAQEAFRPIAEGDCAAAKAVGMGRAETRTENQIRDKE